MKLLDEIDAMIAERHLLTHSFYTKWVAGTLPVESLREYARQYYAFESAFPRFLSAIHSRCERPDVRQTILENLWDEEHGEENHAELWLRFAEGIGLARAEVAGASHDMATRTLVETYRRAATAARPRPGSPRSTRTSARSRRWRKPRSPGFGPTTGSLILGR